MNWIGSQFFCEWQCGNSSKLYCYWCTLFFWEISQKPTHSFLGVWRLMRFNNEGDVAAALQQLQPPIVALRCGHPLTLTWMSVSVWYRSRCYVNSRPPNASEFIWHPKKMSSCHVLGVWLFVLFKMSIQPGVSLLRLASHLQKQPRLWKTNQRGTKSLKYAFQVWMLWRL